MASLEEQRMMEDAPDSSVQVDTGSHWQRLATIAIMYFTVSNIKGMAKGLIYVVPALAVTFNQADGPMKDYLYVGGAALVLLMAVSGLASFLMYRFGFTTNISKFKAVSFLENTPTCHFGAFKTLK